jgi:hypothetical protein
VTAGENVVLRWDLTGNPSEISIDSGIGNVTTNTVSGLGNITVPVNQSSTFVLTIRRGSETLSATTSVAAVSGVSANWALLDNFETYQEGPFPSIWWGDLGGNSRITTLNGNKVLDVRGTARIALLSLGQYTVREGESRTLFSRIYTGANVTEAIRSIVGLTDRSLRFYTDVDDSGGSGPHVRISNAEGDLRFASRNGVGASTEFLASALETNATYNLWINVSNGPVAVGDTFSAYIQREGEASRTLLFEGFIGDRNPSGDPAGAGGSPTRPDLDKLFIGNDSVGAVFFDDLYISKAGFNSTVPRSNVVEATPTLALVRNGNNIVINFTGGRLQSAPTVTGPWTDVVGATAPSFTVTATENARFFRVVR